MNVAKMFTMMVALSSLSLLSIAQQTPATAQQGSSTSTPVAGAQIDDSANAAIASGVASDASTTSAAAVQMRPVNGELVGKLDSKSAKAGGSVGVKTVESMKTVDGTEIPKGSKLLGHVTAVQAHSQAKQNSEMAIQFDHAELKGGQSLAIHSVIESVAPPQSDTAANGSDMSGAPMAASPGGGNMGGVRAGSPNAGSPNSGMTPNNGATQGGDKAGTSA